MSRRIDRRTALKGLGAAVALPWLEAMAPVASAAPAPYDSLSAAALRLPGSRATRLTRAPSARNPMAQARPIPLLPPVTRT